VAASPYDEIRDRLPSPVGDQASVVALPASGHHVVLGTAGSGKTTMAMLRALYLADERAPHAGRTLLVTFNRSLLAFLNHIIGDDANRLHVRNYHHFARGYLASKISLPFGSIVSDQTRRAMIDQALSEVASVRPDAVPRRESSFFDQELKWISQHGVRDESSYLVADRVGRGQALPPTARQAVWVVREAYTSIRAARGHLFDWHDLAAEVCDQFDQDGDPRYYRHVVVDEGQDFSPEMLRSLVKAVGAEGSVTFFGDVAQQIYGRGVSFRSAGLSVQKVWEFKRNFRNSPQIAALGSAIAAMPYFAGQEDMVAPDEFADEGPPPTLVRFTDVATEKAWALQQAEQLGALGATAVLFRREEDAADFAARCPGAQRLDRNTPTWAAGPGIWVGTVHSAKGFEFLSVLLCRLTRERWPEPQAVSADGEEEARATDGRLLYVAVTRARQNLLMTVPGERTDLLPSTGGLWVEPRT
jgi:superfamily I DNA/RNA helicase